MPDGGGGRRRETTAVAADAASFLSYGEASAASQPAALPPVKAEPQDLPQMLQRLSSVMAQAFTYQPSCQYMLHTASTESAHFY